MNGMMTGDVARAMMADRQREYGAMHRLDRVDRPRRTFRPLAALAGLVASAKALRPQTQTPSARFSVRVKPEAA